MLEFLNIVWPQETALRIVICAIVFVAVYVAYLCVRLKRSINANLQIIDLIGNKDNLIELEYTLKYNNIDSLNAFNAFETKYAMNESNEAVFEHLRAIYDAGRKSSRLDADLLVKNTIDKVCANVDSIKTCISVFLVIGILGTLVGLGLSIASFNGDSFIITAQNNNSAAELSKLFGNLRGAFAPSMWGVSCTILYVLLYTFFIQERGINKLTDKLTITTIKVWLPSLYPTDFQKGENTMVQLKETINNAEAINDGTNDLLNNLNSANNTVSALTGVSDVLNTTIDKFEENGSKVEALVDSIKQLQEQLKENNKNYYSFTTNLLSSVQNLQNEHQKQLLDASASVHKNFDEQNKQLTQMLQTLQAYDKSFASSQEKFDKSFNEALVKNLQIANDMQGSINEISQRNQELTEVIGNPIVSHLQEMSGELTDNLTNLTERLQKLTVAIDRIDNPLQKTAGDIQKMFGDMMRRQNEVFLKAKGEFSKEELASLLSNANSNVSQDDATQKEILKYLKEIAENNNSLSSVDEDDNSVIGTLKRYLPFIVCLLLVISIGVQCVMVSRIANLEQSQNVVNQVLLKGNNN